MSARDSAGAQVACPSTVELAVGFLRIGLMGFGGVGPIARHSARAGFMRNLVEAGGLAVVDGPIGGEPAAVVDVFKASGARIAVVTGADADYAEQGVALAAALKEAGATVWLAGRPKDGAAELEAAGIARFVAAGDDALEILTAASNGNGGAA